VTNLPLSGHRVQGHPLLLVEFGDVASRSGFLMSGTVCEAVWRSLCSQRW